MGIDIRNAAAVTVADVKAMSIDELNSWVGVRGLCWHLAPAELEAQRVVSELALMETSARSLAREYTVTELERMRAERRVGRHSGGVRHAGRDRATAIYGRALAIKIG